MFSQDINDHLRREVEKKVDTRRFSQNEVARHSGASKLRWLDEERKIPVDITKSAGIYGKPRVRNKKEISKPIINKETVMSTSTQVTGQHTESSVKIYFTKNYGLFVKMTGNRTLNKTKIKRIKDDIKNGLDLLKYCPIIVAEKEGKLEVIDGQHRFAVAKELGSHVWYIIADELTLLEIAKMNSNTEKWKNKDFIHCYKSQGNKDYEQLDEFMTKYKFPLGVSLILLTTGSILKNGSIDHVNKSFMEGGLKVTSLEKATVVADIVMAFEGFNFKYSRSFVGAVCKIIEAEKTPISEVIEAYLLNKDKLLPQGNWKNYLLNLEQIVNIGKSKRRVIF